MMGSLRLEKNISSLEKETVREFESKCITGMFDSSIFKEKKGQIITLKILIRCFFGDEDAFKNLMSIISNKNFKEFEEILTYIIHEERKMIAKAEIEKKSLLDYMKKPFEFLKGFLEKKLKNQQGVERFCKDYQFNLNLIRIFIQGNYYDLFKTLYIDKGENFKKSRDLLTVWFDFGPEAHRQLQIFLFLLIFIRNPEVDLKTFQNNLREDHLKVKGSEHKMSIVGDRLNIDFLYSLVTLAQNDFSDFIRLGSLNLNLQKLDPLYAWIHMPKYICEFIEQKCDERKKLSLLLGILIFELALPLFTNVKEKDDYDKKLKDLKDNLPLIEIFTFMNDLKKKQNQTVHWYSFKTIAAFKEIYTDLKENEVCMELFRLLKEHFKKIFGFFNDVLDQIQQENMSFEKFIDFSKLFIIFAGYSKFDATEILGEKDKISNLLSSISKLFAEEKKELYHFELLTTGLAMGIDIMEQKKRNKFINSDFWMLKLMNIL